MRGPSSAALVGLIIAQLAFSDLPATAQEIPPNNLIPNPSFESSTAGWVGRDAEVSRVALRGTPDGVYAAKLTHASASPTFGLRLSPPTTALTVVGQSYMASAQVRLANRQAAGKPVAIVLRELNERGIVKEASSRMLFLDRQFRAIGVNGTAVGSGNMLEVSVQVANAPGDSAFYVDAVTLLPPASASPTTTSTTTPPTTATPQWLGDFEGGDFSQWDGFSGAGSFPAPNPLFALDRTTIVGGSSSFKATVDSTAAVPDQAGQRTLVVNYPNIDPTQNKSGAYQNSDQWYHWSTYFPSDFRASPNTAWNWDTVFHNWPDGPCCGHFSFTANTDPSEPSAPPTASGDNPAFMVRWLGGGSPSHPVESGSQNVNDGSNPDGFIKWFVLDPSLKLGHWYDIVLHVRWSWDATGFAELWVDGRLVFSEHHPTLYYYADSNSAIPDAQPGPGQAYLAQGYYRPETVNGAVDTSVAAVYHDGTRHGPTRESVVY